MSLKQRRLILASLSLLVFLLAGCWGLYLHTQAILSHQLAHLAEQSLPSDGPTPSLTIGTTRARGWPFGAWRDLENVSFHTHLNGADIAGATSRLTLGGNWLDWARALTTQDKLPLQMPEVTVLRLVRGGDSLTLRLHKTRLRISKGSTACPTNAASCPANGLMPLYRAHFHLATLEIASSRLPYSMLLHQTAGAIRFAPQSLSRHDPALQDRALLSASLTATRLTSPAALLQDFQIKDLRSNFALLPSPSSAPASSPAQGGQKGQKQPPPANNLANRHSPWPSVPLRLRLHELSATIQPLAPEEQGPPPPRLSLGGELYVPAFSGTLSVVLTNWESPLHILLQSLWFRQMVPASTRSLLHEVMTSPKLESLATKPLMVSLPLDHGLPPGLASGRLRGLYEHLRQLSLPLMTPDNRTSPMVLPR